MSSKRNAGRRKGGNVNDSNSKKAKTAGLPSFFTQSDGGVQSANILYSGKRVLLTAKNVYKNGKVPEDEKGFLFQYHVEKINSGLDTARLEYDGKFIRKDGDAFENYPEENELDNEMDDYRMALFKEDHELYNKYLSRVNGKKNDALDVEKEDEANKKMSALEDVSDIEQKIVNEKKKPYDVLELEFKPSGELVRRVIRKGVDAGKSVINQEWGKHVHDFVL